jgi:ATP-dependent metalloprotease
MTWPVVVRVIYKELPMWPLEWSGWVPTGGASSRQNYGFSEKVGLVAHGDDESVYLSGKKKDEIEGEIREWVAVAFDADVSFLDKGMSRTVNLLKRHEDELHKASPTAYCYWLQIAKALVEYETLSLDEVKTVLSGQDLARPKNEGESLVSQGERQEAQGAVVEGIW